MKKLLSACLCALAAATSSPGLASIQFNFNADQSGNASQSLAVSVLVEQLSDDLKFTVSVVNPLVKTGDLRGIFFHIADTSLLSGLAAVGANVTELQKSANGVNNLGMGANINPLGPFDIGIEFGTPGMASDDIQLTSFVLSHSSLALNLNTFFASAANVTGNNVMAIRATSVGPPGDRGESSKLPSGNPTTVPDGEPTSTPEPMSLAIWGALAAVGAIFTRARVKN